MDGRNTSKAHFSYHDAVDDDAVLSFHCEEDAVSLTLIIFSLIYVGTYS